LKKKIQGSFTIEALLLMPIILFTIFFVLYLSFYFYDYCRVQAVADQFIHKLSINLKHESDIRTGKISYESIARQGVFYHAAGNLNNKKNEIKNYLVNKLSKGLLITKITDIQVSANISEIYIKIEGKLQVPIRAISRIISKKEAFVIEAKGSFHYPAGTVRISEIVLDLGKKIKNIDELKEKIELLLP
jgi:hypothetical protein